MNNLILTSFFLIVCVNVINTNYISVTENLNTLKLIQGFSGIYLTSKCSDAMSEYLNGLKSDQKWALTLLDSSAKIPDGILKGNNQFLGHFDECLSVEHPEKHFTAQHCMINGELFWENVIDQKYYDFLYAMCLPSSCTEEEIEYGLQNSVNALFPNKILSMNLNKGNCRAKESPKLSTGDWVVVGVLVTICVVALTSTIYDLVVRLKSKKTREKTSPDPLLSSFSLYNNGAQLFKISKSSDQLRCLNGLRVLSISWVLLLHAFTVTMNGPTVNIDDLDEIIKNPNHPVIITGYLAVDSFFFLSGLLCYFVFFRDMSKKGYYDVPLAYIHRYIRLTPSFAAMILIQATIFQHLGDGPLWHTFCDDAAKTCQENWWQGLLYVSNFLNPNTTCLSQSWYLSSDMQLHWISPLILYPTYVLPTLGPILLAFLILGSAFTAFAIAYINDLGPSLLITTSAKQNELDYVPFYTRAAPWLIGFTTGYLLCRIQATKIKHKLIKGWVITGWTITTAFCLGSIYGILPFTDRDYTTTEAAFYLAFHRVGWALGLAWIVFACVLGYGGPVNAFLSWNVFQPLGKLSYNTFIVHLAFRMYRMGTMRTNYYTGDIDLVYDFMGDLVLSFLAAIPFTLLFEMPFSNIDRHLFENAKILPLPRL